ncbi:MAG: succinate dehydrogenase/fumarate reductase iron-sulfur subunit [Candidatus Bipolaricaulota bacterium]
MEKIAFRINRYDPESNVGSHFEKFYLDVSEQKLGELTVLDALRELKEERDGSLTFRHTCGHGSCGSCAMLINKKNRLACKTHVVDLEVDEGSFVEISPLPGFPVIKDLVVDDERFFDHDSQIMPFISGKNTVDDLEEERQTPGELDRIMEATECINCGACTSSCPTYWDNEDYLGPAALVRAFRWLEDSRNVDRNSRIGILDDEKDGVWGCNKVFNCIEACPKGIDTVAIIEELKRSVITA